MKLFKKHFYLRQFIRDVRQWPSTNSWTRMQQFDFYWQVFMSHVQLWWRKSSIRNSPRHVPLDKGPIPADRQPIINPNTKATIVESWELQWPTETVLDYRMGKAAYEKDRAKQ